MTEKQIKYATDIMNRALKQAEEYIKQGEKSGMRAIESGKRTQSDVNSVIERYKAALDRLKSKPLSWWLDHTASSGKLLLQIEAKKLA